MTSTLSTAQLLSDAAAMPGAEHSLWKQLASPDAAPMRDQISTRLETAPAAIGQRWRDALTSFDNRRFFQALAEVQTTHHLSTTGWELTGGDDRVLAVQHPDGRSFELLTMGFLRQARTAPDREAIHRLSRTLGRLNARSRIAVLVRRWLPHDFDPEPVRQAVDLWLTEVDRGGWQGIHAAFEDEHLSLEFTLTRRKNPVGRSIVAFTLGPFFAQETVEILETRMVLELDQLRLARPASGAPPVLLACVTNQPWGISPGYLRSLFLGTADITWTAEDGVQRFGFTQRAGPSLFQDPMYHHAAGALMLSMDPSDPRELCGEVHLHPWADDALSPGDIAGGTWAAESMADNQATVRWTS